LADFQSLLKDFQAEGIKIIAGSTDTIEKTEEFTAKLGITYDMAYGMDTEAISEVTGAFYEKEKRFLQPTGFIIRPDRTVEIAVYSSGAVGRFVAKDVLKAIKFYKSKEKKGV
jgi:peroxiredoxin